MVFQDKKQTQSPEEYKKIRPEEQFVPEQRSFGMPNSLMRSVPMTPPPGTPNSVLREMFEPQIPAAEAEADRLSVGITRGTPDSVRRQMGRRLGADFSSVRFHTGPESIRRNDFMGSGAYTRGSDVFFGRGGFEPSIAAHELVHTVQQGAVPGRVSQSVSFGTVQRETDDTTNSIFTDFISEDNGATLQVNHNIYLDGEIRRKIKIENPPDKLSAVHLGNNMVKVMTPDGWEYEIEITEGDVSILDGIKTDPKQAPNAVGTDSAAKPAAAEELGSSQGSEEEHDEAPVTGTGTESGISAQERPASIHRPRQNSATRKRMLERRSQAGASAEERARRAERATEEEAERQRRAAEVHQPVPAAGHDDVPEGEPPVPAAGHDGMPGGEPPVPVAGHDGMPGGEPPVSAARHGGVPGGGPPGLVVDPAVFGIVNHKKTSKTRFSSLTDTQIDGIATQYLHEYGQRFVNPDLMDVYTPVINALQAAQAHAGENPAGGAGGGAGNVAAHNAVSTGIDHRRNTNLAADIIRQGAGYYSILDSIANIEERDRNSAEFAEIAKEHGDDAKFYRPTNNAYYSHVAPIGGGVVDVLDTTASTMNAITQIYDARKAVADRAVGASRADEGMAALNATRSSISAAKGVWKAVGDFGSIASESGRILNVDGGLGIPIVGALTGAFDAGTGIWQVSRAGRAKTRITNGMNELDAIAAARRQRQLAAGGAVEQETANEKKLRELGAQTRKIQNRKQVTGSLKAASGVVNIIGAGLTMGCVPFGGAAATLTSGAINAFKFVYEKSSRYRQRKKVVGEEYGIDWDVEMDILDKMIEHYNKHWTVSRSDRRAILLKAHGSEAKNRHDAYKEVNLNRARYLLYQADPQNHSDYANVAKNIIESMGVHPIDDGNGGTGFAADAYKLLAKKLGE